jgi:hypothetical protein
LPIWSLIHRLGLDLSHSTNQGTTRINRTLKCVNRNFWGEKAQ